ncbi:hypothetical protein ABIB06_002190 [Bradyrhizobium sp. LB8.2]|uniref:hypothetical protein n=1 Tax=unclassified Bradyrhizobium TaxID=2631580 RepID=UPI00339502AA
MTEVSRLESKYDAFLFASLCENDELPLTVLSVLARQDLDPWQEADRLARLSEEQAINSLASRIWKSNSERWSPSEASILAIRVIQLLPSHGGIRSDRNSTEDGDGRMMWLVVGMLAASIAASGDGIRNSLESSGNPDHHVSAVAPPEASPLSSRGVATD